MPLSTRSSIVVLLMLGLSAPLLAQLPALDGLPTHAPINPSSVRRTGLFMAPYVMPSAGWRVGLSLDYGNAIEAAPIRTDGTRYLFDGEIMRLQLDASRDLGENVFLAMSVNAEGSYDGKLDGFIDWVHHRMGHYMEGRETRPRNRYSDTLIIGGSEPLVRDKAPLALGDARVTLGRRHNESNQTLVSVTIPTGGSTELMGRGVPSFAVVHTLRAPFGSRWLYEGTAGVGYTPAHGALATMQRELFGSASSGIRVRLGDTHALYYFVFMHSPYYRGTGVRELEGPEISQDFGWIVRTGDGREWRVGLTEDVIADDQALDVVFKIGVAW
ncbi:MAG TPA: DUF3187 family protein [Gemmatimonadaceae bacterium]|jgi:hypothetical protein|nr:DUF3187 family protein [Gemmatimonadaceae bacterium]